MVFQAHLVLTYGFGTTTKSDRVLCKNLQNTPISVLSSKELSLPERDPYCLIVSLVIVFFIILTFYLVFLKRKTFPDIVPQSDLEYQQYKQYTF